MIASRFAFVAAAAALAGCGASTQVAPSAQSSMSAAVKHSQYLLYAASSSSGDVGVFDFKSQKLLGSTSNPAQWFCSDAKGNVYGGDHSYYGGSEITEFAAGTVTVVKTLSDGLGYPVGCSVNPKNGDLAVTNYYNDEHDGGGNVLIFPNGSGRGAAIYGPEYEWPAGYDPKGNLFLVGEDGMCNGICLVELPYGGSKFVVLGMKKPVKSPIAVEWDGKYLGIGDQEVDGSSTSGIYETVIDGSTAKVVRTVKFTGPSGSDVDITQWANVSSSPNDVPGKLDSHILGLTAFPGVELYEWVYPRGGNPSGQFTAQANPDAAILVQVK